MILMPMGQHYGRQPPDPFLQRRQIRDHQVDPEQLWTGEHGTGVHEDRSLVPNDEQHIHAELAETAQRDRFEPRPRGRSPLSHGHHPV